MRANKIRFKIFNVVVSAGFATVCWYFFNHLVHPAFFLIPFCWILYARATHSRLNEINDRLHLYTDLLATILEKDENFNFADYLNEFDDDYDFY